MHGEPGASATGGVNEPPDCCKRAPATSRDRKEADFSKPPAAPLDERLGQRPKSSARRPPIEIPFAAR